ncbi:MAG TPA: DUF1015 family protein [Candidatus Polarisedimenticolaceae bacterium]
MIVKPFRGLRPSAALASRIPSLPYDVLDSDEARRLAAGDPYTFLHVVKSEIDLDPSIGPYDDRVYAKALENFRAMRASGWLVRDASPSYYVYRQALGSHAQTGIVGTAAVADYDAGRIKRHEHTRPEKENDRTRHAATLGANPGPIFLAHRGHDGLEAASSRAAARTPAADFVAADGVAHTLWVVDDPLEVAAIESAFRDLPATYIADGHHRAASYARVARERGDASSSRLLAAHFPASQLKILDYNRLVRDLNGLDVPALLERIRAAGFDLVDPWPARKPEAAATFGLYVGGSWRLLKATPGVVPQDDPVRRLDVSVLAEKILGPILGIGDPRTDRRIEFVGGIRGMDELERRVRSGEFAAAFSMFPTRMDDVMAVADAGLVMPPKSTWFEPKLRSGMVVHVFDEE